MKEVSSILIPALEISVFPPAETRQDQDDTRRIPCATSEQGSHPHPLASEQNKGHKANEHDYAATQCHKSP